MNCCDFSKGDSETGLALLEMTAFVPFILALIFLVVEAGLWFTSLQNVMEVSNELAMQGKIRCYRSAAFTDCFQDDDEQHMKLSTQNYLQTKLKERERPHHLIVFGVKLSPANTPQVIGCIRTVADAQDGIVIPCDITTLVALTAKYQTDAQLIARMTDSRTVILAEVRLDYEAITPVGLGDMLFSIFRNLNPEHISMV